jgi:YaiO family outer membrane protein
MILLLALAAASPADTGARWRAEAGYAVEVHSRDRAAWQTVRTAFGHRWARATLTADLQTASRFGRWEQAGGLETYFAAGRRWSGYARLQVAPGAEVLPRTDASGQLTAAVARGWEATAGYRRMGFSDETVDIVSVGAARYAGVWYLQALGSAVPGHGTTGFGVALLARRYADPDRPDRFIEFRGSAGREVVLLGPATAPDLRATGAAGVRYGTPLARDWGLSVAATWTAEDRVPSRTGVAVSFYRTW